MNVHYHIVVADNLERITGYIKYDGYEEAIFHFISLCKELTGAKVGDISQSYADLKQVAENQFNFFISSEGKFFVVGWTDCWEGMCAKAYLN